MSRREDPLSILMKKLNRPNQPLSSAEQALHDWFIRNPANTKRREMAYTMRDMGEFMRPYGPYAEIEIEADKKLIREEREKKSRMDQTERSEILEAVFENWASKGKWFGDDCEIIPTLEFDDRRNHTDFVLEFRQIDGEIVRLAVDCAVTENEDVLSDKAFYTAKGIETNFLTTIKYFKSPRGKRKGKINLVPRAIVIVEKNRLDELCRSILPAINNNDHRSLKSNYIQYFLLAEIKSQMEAQLSLIKNGKVSKTRNFGLMQSNIAKVAKIFNDLLKQKESSLAPSVVERAKQEIKESSSFSHLSLLSRKGARELRY